MISIQNLALMEIWVRCSIHIKSKAFAIAGGAVSSVIQGQTPKDVDCFFGSCEEYELAETNLRHNPEFRIVKERKNSILFSHATETLMIDIVRPERNQDGSYKSYDEIVDNFDLVHICMYFSPEKGIVQVNPDSIKYSMEKIIKIHKVCLPYHTLGRISKYRHRGFFIGPEEERLILDYCYKAHWGASAEAEYNF